MRNKAFFLGFILCMLAMPGAAQTRAEVEREKENRAAEFETAKPEYSRRSLPSDTFKPSEEISEDYSVPFPVDI
jgi:hypothetical protein